MNYPVQLRRYVWTQPSAELRWMWKPLVEQLASELNAVPLMLVNSAADRNFYLNQFGREFEGEIVIKPDIYEMTVSGKYDVSDEEAIRIVSAFELRYGLLFYRDMLLPDRQLGRAFLSGADGLPSSRVSESATSGAIVAAGATMVKFYESLQTTHPPVMILTMSSGVGVQGKPLAAIARHLNIPFRNMMHTRFGFRYYWAEDEFGNSSWLNEKLKTEPKPSPEQIKTVLQELRPTGDFEFYVNTKRKRAQILPMLKFLAATAVKHARYHAGRSRKSRIGYRMLDEMAMILRGRRHRKLLLGRERPMVSELPPGRKVVFFPLQVEPEISLHGLAPLFIDQMNTINHLSQHLPVDAVLVVKEHPAQIGRRSDAFYRKLMSFPNVMLLNELEHSYPLIRRADLIVTVTSSVAHEAAVMGRSVVYLANAGPLTTVPHVRFLQSVKDFAEIPELLRTNRAATEDEWIVNGVRYYLGLKRHAVSFDNLGTALFDRKRTPDEDEIAQISDTVLATLQPLAVH